MSPAVHREDRGEKRDERGYDYVNHLDENSENIQGIMNELRGVLPSKETTERSASLRGYQILLEAKKLTVDSGRNHSKLDKAINDMKSKLFY